MDTPYVDWRLQGKCGSLTPEQYDKMFFPEAGRSIKAAVKFCSNCPVRNECLEEALRSGESGIWAGTTRRERIGILKFRARTSCIKPRVVSKKNFVFS